MKTAISLDDELMREADRVAREVGVSRSRLFAMAIKDYLQRLKREQIVEQLDAIRNGLSLLFDRV